MAFTVNKFIGAHGLTLVFLTSLLLTCHDVTSDADNVEHSTLHDAGKETSSVDFTGLVNDILDLQFNETDGFKDKQPATLAGLFPTEVRIGVNGEPAIAAIRNDNSVLDLSSLATLLTLNALVEATVRGQLEKPATSNLVQALEALSSFRSPLFGENRSALVTFWPTHTSGKAEEWSTVSENAVKGGSELRPVVILEKALTDCKKKCPLANATLSKIKSNRLCLDAYNQSLSDYADEHSFPPDVTSSFANLALGALLADGGSVFSSVFDVWKSSNANFSALMQHVHKYTYRPLSTDSSADVIDSRSYYVIEKFLSQRNESQLEKDAFVANWIPQKMDDGRLQYGKKVLPVYNTLDLFGTATFLHAVTSAVLTNLTGNSDTIQTLITSNLDLVSWVVSNGERNDHELLMTTHPSVFQFYWMLSRTMFVLENARIQDLKTYQSLERFYSKWNTTVRAHVTETILNLIQDGGLDDKGTPLVYVDDIIGTGDVNDKGKKEPSGSDRLFTTATAASALLSAWTTYTNKHTLVFLPDTPDDVALATKRMVNYVITASLNEKSSCANVIRTSLHTHCESLSYWFPANSITTTSGTNFTGNTPSPEVLFGMRGHVTSDQYDAMLAEPHFGQTVAGSMPGMNSTSAVYFYWSSLAYTRSMSLLAMAHMKNTKGKADSEEKLKESFTKKTS